MKNYIYVGIGFGILLILAIVVIWSFRALDRATANLTIRTIEPGINCAVLLDRTSPGGNAISCYPSTTPAKQ